MKRIVLFALLLLPFWAFRAVWAQGGLPTGFSYQALIFDQGKPAKERTVVLEIFLQDAQGEIFYAEHHPSLKTSASGAVAVSVGEGQILRGTIGAVPWERGIWIAARVDLGNGFVSLGPPVKLQAAPYALFAMATPRVRGREADAQAGRPIFEVKDSKGQQLFGVYEEGVRMVVTDDPALPEETVSGFKLSSRRLSPAATEVERERIRIGSGGILFTVDEQERGVRGGFAVATRRRTADAEPVMRFGLAQDGAFFTVDDFGGRGPRGGFAVATRSFLRSDGGEGRVDRLRIADGGIRLLVDPVTRGVRGGFAVAARAMLRGSEEQTEDLFVLSSRQTYFTVRPGGVSSFSFRDRADVRRAIMNVTGEGKIVARQGEADKVLRPIVEKEASAFSVYVAQPGATQWQMSNLSRWLPLGLEYKNRAGQPIRSEDVTVFVEGDVPLVAVPIRSEDGSELWGLKYTGRHDEAAPGTVDASRVRVCMRNFPDRCASVQQNIVLLPIWLEKSDLSINTLQGKIENGELKIEPVRIWKEEIGMNYPNLPRNAKLEFTSSLEGFYGVIENDRLICTNRDLQALERMKGLHSDVALTLVGEQLREPITVILVSVRVE